MCCDPIPARPKETVAKCGRCGTDVDYNGESTEEGCRYSPVACDECGDRPCDLSC